MLTDRDNTLIQDSGYVHQLSELRIYTESFAALRLVKDMGGSIAIITNQGGIALGKFSLQDFGRFNLKMINEFASHGIEIDFVIACPHHPLASEVKERLCDCRKPHTAMLTFALERYKIARARVAFFGDADSDIHAASSQSLTSFKIDRREDLVKHVRRWLAKD
jgi:D-glycero-D-manno-heptose 1,7-bisphosphate phosphatase